MPTDAELLRRYAEEKAEQAFTELVARSLDLVYSAALRQAGGDAHAAEDLTQVVFTTLARKAHALAEHPVLAGWLYTATQHAAAKHRRAEGRRRAREKASCASAAAHRPAARRRPPSRAAVEFVFGFAAGVDYGVKTR